MVVLSADDAAGILFLQYDFLVAVSSSTASLVSWGLEVVGGAEWRGRAMEDSCVPTSLRSAGGNKCGTWPMLGIWSCLLCVYPV